MTLVRRAPAPFGDLVSLRTTMDRLFDDSFVRARGWGVNEALAMLKFSKKRAAGEITKVLESAVANAEQAARQNNESLDVDALFVKKAIINEGQKLKRWTPAAMGRATPVFKRTSHVEIVVAEKAGR